MNTLIIILAIIFLPSIIDKFLRFLNRKNYRELDKLNQELKQLKAKRHI